jgi:hypothetical protein
MAEEIDPRLIEQLVTLNEDEVILPLRVMREEVTRIKAVKLSDVEIQRVAAFQDYLFDQKFIPENTFASLFIYAFNVTFTAHKHLSDELDRKEGVTV